MFKFKRLIDKYSVSVSIEYADIRETNELGPDDYDNLGHVIQSYQPSVMEKGTLIPVSERSIYHAGGRFTEDDRMFYSTNPNIPDKSRITYKGKVYQVISKEDVSDHSIGIKYMVKRVSSFD